MHVEAHNLTHDGAQNPCSSCSLHGENPDGVPCDLGCVKVQDYVIGGLVVPRTP